MRFLSPIQITILARRLSTTISRVVLFDSIDNNNLVSLFQHYKCLCVQDLIDPWTWVFVVSWIWFLQNTRIDEMKKFFHQNIMTLTETYTRATNDEATAKEVREFMSGLGKKMGVLA